jgi:putative membrane protein
MSVGVPRSTVVAVSVFFVLVAATWWRPIWPVEQAMHHSLTLVAVTALVAVQRHRRLSLSSVVLVLGFLALHTVAARWIYSYVPYARWATAIGWHIDGGRNNFDRLVHVAYGLCFGPVLLQYLRDRGVRTGLAALLAVDIVISTGAVYELFEWGIAMTLAPEAAEAYNGQQGDVWDAQKDMAVAALGAVVSVGIALVLRRRSRSAASTISTMDNLTSVRAEGGGRIRQRHR